MHTILLGRGIGGPSRTPVGTRGARHGFASDPLPEVIETTGVEKRLVVVLDGARRVHPRSVVELDARRFLSWRAESNELHAASATDDRRRLPSSRQEQVEPRDPAGMERQQHDDARQFDQVLVHEQVGSLSTRLRGTARRDRRQVEHRQKPRRAPTAELRQQAEQERETDQREAHRHGDVDPSACRRSCERLEESGERAGCRASEITGRAPSSERLPIPRPPREHQLVVALVEKMPADERPKRDEREPLES